MTDKIMINGVDVSGCEFFENGQCYKIDARNCEGYIHDEVSSCDDNPNCYYKQLARKTEECERLNAQYNAVVEQNRHLQEELKCERHIKPTSKKAAKYYKALEEIKETAHDLRTRTDYRSPDEVNADIDKILQKCEVIDCE